MSDGRILFEVADAVATITIDRPAKRNALTSAMCAELTAVFRSAAGDPAVRAIVLTSSSDDVFTAGADLNDPPPRFLDAIPNVGIVTGKPIIAVVSGLVIGGGVTMVAMSDLCVASETARFIYPEAKVGIGIGLIASLAARIPHKIATELMLTGEPITAQRAYEVGFVNRVAPVSAYREVGMALARTLAANAPLVVGMLKQFSLATIPQSPAEKMHAAQREIDVVLGSHDAKEGPAAFRAKRTPKFEGR